MFVLPPNTVIVDGRFMSVESLPRYHQYTNTNHFCTTLVTLTMVAIRGVLCFVLPIISVASFTLTHINNFVLSLQSKNCSRGCSCRRAPPVVQDQRPVCNPPPSPNRLLLLLNMSVYHCLVNCPPSPLPCIH